MDHYQENVIGSIGGNGSFCALTQHEPLPLCCFRNLYRGENMETRNEFRKRVGETLATIDPEILKYDESEFWMYRTAYEYVDYYATQNRMWNTKIALPLARGMHDGTHRKSSIMKDGEIYRLPYLIHPLQVCRMLIDLQIAITKKEEDVMIASALCHDMIEDIPFENGGWEMVTDFHLDPAVYETVKAVSKRRDFTEEEEKAFFLNIENNKLAMLVKLSDRGNNVEDLYNMSLWKVHEYADETRKFFIPMCDHAKLKYPEIKKNIQMFKNKMITLIKAAEVLSDRYAAEEERLQKKVQTLREENQNLRVIWQTLWNAGGKYHE